MTSEQQRLNQARAGVLPWKKWGPYPVSYTHLDVYKRQHLHIARLGADIDRCTCLSERKDTQLQINLLNAGH